MSNGDSGFANLASLLWREREILQRVLFKIVEEKLVVAAGETRWLPAANHEVEAAIRDMRTTEVERAAEADALAEQLGMGSGLTLAALADAAPQPWDEILREHRVALSALAAEIDAATAEARQLLEAGGRGVREALEALDAGKLKPATGPHTEHATRLNRQA